VWAGDAYCRPPTLSEIRAVSDEAELRLAAFVAPHTAQLNPSVGERRGPKEPGRLPIPPMWIPLFGVR